MENLGTRFWVESALAFAGATLLVVTLIGRSWIENVFKIEPDAGSGTAEWMLTGVALAVVVASVTLAGREWKRRQSVQSRVV